MGMFREKVREALAELADLDYQRRVWTGADPRGEMASFEECVEALYGDSGLALAFESGGVIFDPSTDDRLRALDGLIGRIATNGTPDALLNDPMMATVRLEAAEILRGLGCN
jgi:hypothetical protein